MTDPTMMFYVVLATLLFVCMVAFPAGVITVRFIRRARRRWLLRKRLNSIRREVIHFPAHGKPSLVQQMRAVWPSGR